jgi:hypothetical protein
MFFVLTSHIMRTTIDLSDPVLRDLKRLREKEGGSLGALASRLLADALAARHRAPQPAAKLSWSSQAMRAKVDLGDKEAVYRAMEGR